MFSERCHINIVGVEVIQATTTLVDDEVYEY